MLKERRRGRKGPSERSYARLTRYERQTIERMLDQGKGCREKVGQGVFDAMAVRPTKPSKFSVQKYSIITEVTGK